jgi:hypothetical protein
VCVYHVWQHCAHGLWVRSLSSWRDRRRREQGMLPCNSEGRRISHVLNAVFCNAGSTGWWTWQHNQDARATGHHHQFGSSTFFPVVTEILIF